MSYSGFLAYQRQTAPPVRTVRTAIEWCRELRAATLAQVLQACVGRRVGKVRVYAQPRLVVTARDLLVAGAVAVAYPTPGKRNVNNVGAVAVATKPSKLDALRRPRRQVMQGVDPETAKQLGFRVFDGWVTVPEAWREKRGKLVAYDLTEQPTDPRQVLRPIRADKRLLSLPTDVLEERFLARMKRRAG